MMQRSAIDTGISGDSNVPQPCPVPRSYHHAPPRLKPRSADDVNPVYLHHHVTEWLQSPSLVKQEMISHAGGSSAAIFDLRQMTRSQLLDAARRHNSSLNIGGDPASEILEGVRDRARIRDPSCIVSPCTLGGGSKYNDASLAAAWSRLADPGAFSWFSQPEKVVRHPLPSTAAAAAASPTVAGGQSHKMVYGHLSLDQQKFNAALSAFLGVKVKLPLLFPGAVVLDLRRLFVEVHSLGGFQAASESDAWSHLSKSLQHNSHLGNELRQIYRYFLLPLEDIVPSKELESRQARYTLEQSRLLELLEAKGKERRSCTLLPKATHVISALRAASRALKSHPDPARASDDMTLEPSHGSAQSSGGPAGPSTNNHSNPVPVSVSAPAVPLDPIITPSTAPRLAIQFLRQISRGPAQFSESGGVALRLTESRSNPIRCDQNPAADAKPQGSQKEDGDSDVVPSSSPSPAVKGGPQGGRRVGKKRSRKSSLTESADPQILSPSPTQPGLSWEEVRPLELLLLSFRQLQAGPPVLWQRPPKLFTSHGSEERVGNEDNGDDDDWDCLIVPRNNKPQHLSTPAAGRLPRAPLPPGRFRTFKGITPKCGKCLTCERPKMKKACVVNRERLAQGLEPEFRTAEARKKHDMKTLRIKEEEAFEQQADPEDRQQMALLGEMRTHLKKLQDQRKNEDPRLSFSTPEFKEAQRVFTENFKKNFGRPVEWALVKEYPWSTPQLKKLESPVDVNGNPWNQPK